MNIKKIYVLLLTLITVLACLMVVACGENTEVSSSASEDNSSVQGISMPDLSKDNSDTKEKIEYTVTVVDENGDPIEGISVQFCDDVACQYPLTTNSEGKVVSKLAASNYHIKIADSNGYIVEKEEYDFENDSYEMTITLTSPAE